MSYPETYDDVTDEDAADALRHKHHKSAPVPIHPTFYEKRQDEADAEATDAAPDWSDDT